jgi:Subtilase family
MPSSKPTSYVFEPPHQPGPTYLVFADPQWLDDVDGGLESVNGPLESEAGWSLRKESDQGTVEGVVLPLLLSPSEGGAIATTPPGALCVLRDIATRRGVGARRGLVLDDLLIDGMPAHKGGALTRGDFNRVPVAVVTPSPPPRRERGGLPDRRRPVIALFDTAISPHPWLDTDDPDDPIWLDAEDYGCKLGPRAPARGESRGPRSSTKELESDFGHGTFSAGVIRQIAPDALILLLRVMHDDGMVHGDHLLNALGWIHDGRQGQATLGELQPNEDPRPFVDVVCLPLGYELTSKDKTFADWLGKVLEELGEDGVRIVSAAGNDGTDEATYPAAFATARSLPSTPLVSVGALNPNGRTRAHYSNYGDWVTDWVVGTSVVSSFPLIDGGAHAEVGGEGRDSESVDPDDFTGGFSRWSGTSFAATALAARIGQALLATGALTDPALDAHKRAEIALRASRAGA